MPWMFAQDLNWYLAENPGCRCVLFIDEYERMVEGAGAGAPWERNRHDQCLRRFLFEAKGLLAVFFTRNRLAWEIDAAWRDRLKEHHYQLPGLSSEDAEDWLQRAGIADAELRRMMIAGSRETSAPDSPIYPKFLELQLEHWRNLVQRKEPVRPSAFSIEDECFEGRCRSLVERLLGDYPDAMQLAMQVLAASRRFDRKSFEAVCREFNIALPYPAFDRLANLSIVSATDGGWLAMPRIIADVICEVIDEGILQASMGFLLQHFSARANPAHIRDVDDAALACLYEAFWLRRQQSDEGCADWLEHQGATIRAAGRHVVLEQLWSDCLSHCEHRGDRNREIALCHSRIAYNRDAQGRYREAGRSHLLALEAYEAIGQSRSVEAATVYSNFAYCLCELARFEQAEMHQRHVCEVFAGNARKAPAEFAAAQSNLARIAIKRDDLSQAETLAREALAIRRALPGGAPLAVAESRTQLGMILDLHWQNDPRPELQDEAERLHQEGLGTREAVLADTHVATAESYEGLAVHLDMRWRFGEAELMFRKCAEIYRKVLGEHDPRTAKSHIHLGTNLSNAARYRDALKEYRKGLRISLAVRGNRHPDIAICRHSIACVLLAFKSGAREKARRSLRARRQLEEALSIFRETLPPSHFRIPICAERLASLDQVHALS